MKTLTAMAIIPLLLLLAQSGHLSGKGVDPEVDPFLKTQLQYRKLEPQLAKARRDVAKKNWERARERLAPVLADRPDHHEAHFLMASILNAAGDYERARLHLEQAETALNQQRALCAAWQEKNRAGIELEEKNRRELLSGEATRGKVHSSCSRGDSTMDQGQLERSTGGSPSSTPVSSLTPESFGIPPAYSFLHGNCLFQLRRFAEAEQQYLRALRVDPGHAPSHNNLINLLRVQNRLAEAQAALKRADEAHAKINPELRAAVSTAVQEGVQ